MTTHTQKAKPLLLLTALLLCGSAQADFIADIYRTPTGNYLPDPSDLSFAGSIVYPSDPTSPALSLMDWHPFGLTWFSAHLYGTLDIQQAGTGTILFQGAGTGSWGIPGIGGLDLNSSRQLTLTPGQYNFDIGFYPDLRQNADGQRVPTGFSSLELVDVDHAWGDPIAVPECSPWWLWILPLGLLLWRRK